MIIGHILKYMINIWTLWACGGPKGRNPFFSFFFYYSSIISLSIQMSFGRTIFNFNPQKTHYLYPPFFPTQRLKREIWPFKGPSGHNRPLRNERRPWYIHLCCMLENWYHFHVCWPPRAPRLLFKTYFLVCYIFNLTGLSDYFWNNSSNEWNFPTYLILYFFLYWSFIVYSSSW